MDIKKILREATEKLDSYNFKGIKEFVEKNKVSTVAIIPLNKNINKKILQKLIEQINNDLLLKSLNMSVFPYFLPIENIKIPRVNADKYELHKAIYEKISESPIYLDNILIYGLILSSNDSCDNIPFSYSNKIKTLVCSKDIQKQKWIKDVASAICIDVAWTRGIAGYIPFFSVSEKNMYKYIDKKHKELFNKIAIRLNADEIDSFNEMKNVNSEEIQKSVPVKLTEKEIKEAIREIIGEAFDQGDWGGEQSDLFTTQVKYKKQSLRAAFLLKGWRGVRGTLTQNKLGKNGNQITRLFNEPADIYILQFSGKIDSNVYDQMETYAKGKQKKFYSILDGIETARLLKAHNFLK